LLTVGYFWMKQEIFATAQGLWRWWIRKLVVVPLTRVDGCWWCVVEGVNYFSFFFLLGFSRERGQWGSQFVFLCLTNHFIFLKSPQKIIPSNLSPPTFYVCVCKPIYKFFFCIKAKQTKINHWISRMNCYHSFDNSEAKQKKKWSID
jgi:hypothetical protein